VAAHAGASTSQWLTIVCERLPGLGDLVGEGMRTALIEACSRIPLPRRPPWITGSPVIAMACYGKNAEEQHKVLADSFPVGITRAARFS
jgi:hypothetical protein